jgi:hypothetical protein
MGSFGAASNRSFFVSKKKSQKQKIFVGKTKSFNYNDNCRQMFGPHLL